jgi:hypothetical protein
VVKSSLSSSKPPIATANGAAVQSSLKSTSILIRKIQILERDPTTVLIARKLGCPNLYNMSQDLFLLALVIMSLYFAIVTSYGLQHIIFGKNRWHSLLELRMLLVI